MTILGVGANPKKTHSKTVAQWASGKFVVEMPFALVAVLKGSFLVAEPE